MGSCVCYKQKKIKVVVVKTQKSGALTEHSNICNTKTLKSAKNNKSNNSSNHQTSFRETASSFEGKEKKEEESMHSFKSSEVSSSKLSCIYEEQTNNFFHKIKEEKLYLNIFCFFRPKEIKELGKINKKFNKLAKKLGKKIKKKN